MFWCFCILFHVFFGVSAVENDENKTVLTLAVLLPLSSQNLDGRPYLPAMDLALELINNRTDILPDYHLEAVVNDSACSAGPSVRSFIDQIFQPPVKVGMIGPICSTATQPVAELANYWNLVLISAGASNPRLSNVEEYPTFLRTVSSDSAVVDGIIMLMKQFGWTRVASITQQEFLFTATYSELSEAVTSNNLSESRNFQFESNSNPQGEVEKLRNSPFRIIFLNMYPIKGIEIICQAQELGMTLDNGYVWLLYDWYGSNWWTRGPGQQSGYEPYNCSISQRRAFVKGMFSIDHFPFVEEEKQNETTSLGISLNKYYSLYNERLNRDYSDLEDLGLFTVPFTPLFVDAIWTMALALHKTEIDSRGSLADFTYESTATRELIFQNALEVQFQGITGLVSYKSTGDRNGYVRYFQYREDSSSGEISSVLVAFVSDNQFTYAEGESETTIFTEGEAPRDKRADYINLWLFVCCTVFACIGITFAIGCLIFNLVFSQKKVIKLSSPYLNVLIILGSILFYIDVILLGLDKAYVPHYVANAFCMITVWIATIAFSLLFGTMFAKTWRVYYIFHASDQRKKTNKILVNDGFLFMLVGVLVIIDLLFLVPITAIPSTRLQLETQELPSSDSHLPVEVCVCSAVHRYVWLGVLFVYKGVLLTIGVFLAFETRKVKISQLNDSHLIAMCVYTTVVLSIALAPIGLVLETNVDVFYAIVGLMVLFGTTLVLCLLYVPKIYNLTHNPSGEVTSTSLHGTTNKAGFEERRNTDTALRQEVEKLRMELAKNRKISEVSISSMNQPCSKVYTISEVARAATPRARSVSDADSTFVSPKHFKYSTDHAQPRPSVSLPSNGSVPFDSKALETIASADSGN